MFSVLEAEKKSGIETFYTDFKGVKGKIKAIPEDFVVEEISDFPTEQKKGRFAIAEVKTINWETNRLINVLSNRLHISRKRINFSGTKDKRADTKRLMSFYRIPIKKLEEIEIGDVEIKNIYTSDQPVKIGNLKGNKFKIKIRNIDSKIDKKGIKKSINFFQEKKFFPNFFGIQRFGIIRPITHIVGKYLVKDDIKKAVMTYIANPTEDEDEVSYNARKKLEETHDFSEALKTYPDKLNFEKAILNKLVLDPDDYVGALKELPKNLLTMFVYAYQSYLFNRILSQRIKSDIPIDKAIIGDYILPIRKNRIDDEPIKVSKNNIEKVNLQISKGKAAVSGILLGTDTAFSEGEMGEIEHKIIQEEKIDPRDFLIPEIPFISSYGSRRPISASINNLDSEFKKDDLNPGKKVLKLNFELKKGCYATSFLREIMKAEDIRDY